MNQPDVVITFDSAADVWRVHRGELAIEITLEEMLTEYYRWKSSDAAGEWRTHAEAFCRMRLEVTPKVIRASE